MGDSRSRLVPRSGDFRGLIELNLFGIAVAIDDCKVPVDSAYSSNMGMCLGVAAAFEKRDDNILLFSSDEFLVMIESLNLGTL